MGLIFMEWQQAGPAQARPDCRWPDRKKADPCMMHTSNVMCHLLDYISVKWIYCLILTT